MIYQKKKEAPVLYWTLIGSLTPDNRLKHLPGILTEHPPRLRQDDITSPLRIDLLDESGRLLVTQKVPVVYYCPDKRHRIRDIPIEAKVPFNKDTKIIRFWNGKVMVKEWKRMKAKPAIKDLKVDRIQGYMHLHWKASHAEGAQMQYVVRFSGDGGKTFNRLSKRLEIPEYKVSEKDIPGGNGWLFQVAATDGVNTTTIESEPMDLPQTPPLIEISNPPNGCRISVGTRLMFRGELIAFLGEDVSINSVLWTSDRDGALSDQLIFETDRLTPGVHQITLKVEDSLKRKLTSNISLHVK